MSQTSIQLFHMKTQQKASVCVCMSIIKSEHHPHGERRKPSLQAEL